MRDRQLDILRGFTMIHIVCVIHVLWFFGLAREPLFSFLLFEMPAIFFIAGASQRIKNNGNNKDNYYHSGNNNSGLWSDLLSLGLNRIRRILFPYWRFLIVLYLFLAVVTFLPIDVMSIDITALTWQEIIKTIMTGGCTHIPYYGYTWFISCYLIIILSLPIQQRLLNHIDHRLYLGLNILLVIVMSYAHFPVADIEIHNLPVYNTFFIAGYIYYRGLPLRNVALAAIACIMLTIWFISNDNFFSLQAHKFPADYIFMVYGMAAISTVSVIISILKPYIGNKSKRVIYAIAKPWNTYGYDIYLYQTIYYIIVTVVVYPWAMRCSDISIQFTLLFISIYLSAMIIPLWITMWKTVWKTRL